MAEDHRIVAGPTSTRTDDLSPSAVAVAYASDSKRDLSPTPATPIGDVHGVADTTPSLSMG
jgi:hypothetical protein